MANVRNHGQGTHETPMFNFATCSDKMVKAEGRKHITTAPITNTVVLSALLSLRNLSLHFMLRELLSFDHLVVTKRFTIQCRVRKQHENDARKQNQSD